MKVPIDENASDFAKLSGMPQSYFEKLGSEYPDDDFSALRVFLALRSASRRVDAATAHWFDLYGLSATKVDVLHLVSASADGTTVGRLREHLLMTQPNVTMVVASLEGAGLVRRTIDPSDKRSMRIRLTASGRRLIAKMTRGHLAALEQSVAVLKPRDRDEFIRSLWRLTQSFETTRIPK